MGRRSAQFVPRYLATIGVDFGVKSVVVDGRELKVNFWDLSGVRAAPHAPLPAKRHAALAGHAEFQDVRNEFYKDTQAVRIHIACGECSCVACRERRPCWCST